MKQYSEVVEDMERETGIEPATSSLGKYLAIVNKGLRRLWRSFLVRSFAVNRAFSDLLLSKVIKVEQSAMSMYRPAV